MKGKSSKGKLRARDSRENAGVEFPKLTPKLVVGSVATLVVLILLFGGDIRRALVGGYNPRISFARGNESSERRASARHAGGSAAQNVPVFDGEVYRAEGRLREASAVAIAASLAGIARITERRPIESVDELLTEIINRRLLPPGVEFIPERKLFVSEHSTIHVRFCPDPFGVEILSLGRERLDGAGLIVRVPDEAGDGPKHRQRYFYSFRLENISVPEAFAPASSALAAGWQMDYFDAQLPEGANTEQLAAWTREHGGQSR